jgi:lysophospholipase L1-like esterase
MPVRVRPVLLIVAALLLALPGSGATSATAPEPAVELPLPLPTSMAALGDSITTAYNACGRFEDCPERSWSTGTDAQVNSHYQRLLARSPEIEGQATNLARSGAKINDLERQASEAVKLRPTYVTVLIGANDACTSSEQTMTSVADFRRQLDRGLAVLMANLRATRLLIASIPDLLTLWEVEHRDRVAQFIWSVGSVCQSMLQDARAVDDATNARRARVRQRVADFNQQLREACSAYGRLCRFDDNAVFNSPFTAGNVSSWDAFHPDVTGQALIAETTNDAGFQW